MSYTGYDILRDEITKKIQEKYKYGLLKKCDIGLSTVIIKSSLINKGVFPNLKTQENLWLNYLRKIIIQV